MVYNTLSDNDNSLYIVCLVYLVSDTKYFQLVWLKDIQVKNLKLYYIFK